jgi:hypothetical protein
MAAPPALRASDTVCIDVEAELFEPVPLFLGEEDEGTVAVPACAQEIHVVPPRIDRIVLAFAVSDERGLGKDSQEERKNVWSWQ